MDKKEITLKVTNIITGNFALSSEEGDKVYKEIQNIINEVDVLWLDFSDIKSINTAFFNTAIGVLFKDYSSEFLNKHLKIKNLESIDLDYLKESIAAAKDYYKSPEDHEKISKENVDND